MKNIKWNVKIINPMNEDELLHKLYDSIEHIHTEHTYLPLSTWKNIALGRSKVYKNFINIEKEDYSNIE